MSSETSLWDVQSEGTRTLIYGLSGAAITLYGLLAVGPLRKLSGLALGSALLYRAVTGRRSAEESATSSPSKSKPFGNGTRDAVDEASWESFPASDPPAY